MAYMKIVRAHTRHPESVASPDARINARLDAQAASQLDYLTTTTGMGVSEVVRASLAHYYATQRARQTPALVHLTPLIGRFRSGRKDTSSRVKQVVADYLGAKREPAGRGRIASKTPVKAAGR